MQAEREPFSTFFFFLVSFFSNTRLPCTKDQWTRLHCQLPVAASGTLRQEGRWGESFSTSLSAILPSLLVAAAGMWAGHLWRHEERESSSTSFSTSLSAIFGFMAGSTQADYIVSFRLLQREH